MRTVQVVLILSGFACLSALGPSALWAADSPNTKRVLLIHQEGVTRPVRAKFDAAFVSALRADVPQAIEVYEESVDPERFSGDTQSATVKDYLKSKYADLSIDVMAVVGDQALGFAREIRETFGRPPIVAAVSPRLEIDANQGITGLQGGRWIGETIDLGLALRPGTRNLFVVDGARHNSGQLEMEIRRQVDERRGLNLVYLRDLPLRDVVSRVELIPRHSIVLFVRQTIRDAEQSLDPLEGLAQVVKASPVPVFGQMEEFLAEGVVGGYMWRSETDAKRMAEMVRQLANGASPRDVTPAESTFAPQVDWRQLQRWNLSESLLPVGTSVLFQEKSLIGAYGHYVAGGLIVIAAQLALIAAFLTQSVKRRRAEERTRASEEQYRSVVETQSELICRFLPDTTLTFVNDAYCRFSKKGREELLGTKFIELIPPAARDGVLERIGHLRGGTDSHEHPVILADGTIGWHHWVNQAIVDERGEITELQGVGRDITDRKNAEEALGKVEARNTAMLRAVPDLMFVLNRDGRLLDYHARDDQLLFVPPEAFLGKTMSEVMPPELSSRLTEALGQALGTSGPVVIEYELHLGEPRAFEARLISAGHDTVLSIIRDVTDSKRVIELNRDLAGRLIASQESERLRVARELHDDLSQKIALMNIELDQIATEMMPGDQQERLQRISMRAGEIASDMHNLSHDLHPSKLQALGLVAALQALCRDVTQRRGIVVAFTHNTLREPVDADVSLCLYRVTQEALHNVARHSRARDAAVRLTNDQTHLHLQITDSGVGFDTSGVQPEGLGLISMRERVGFLRGEFTIQASPGSGCRICARIPLTHPARGSSSMISRSA